ncbi:MAG: hypothetical protein KKA79_06635 [Nanoarchaeota archaeon]|nr:hypothetical protein [Nanoarchaeota archaeon]MCG2718187.1 hypothetical protein [Nanoarchaeota archaeon]
MNCPKCKVECEEEEILRKKLPRYSNRMIFIKEKWFWCPACGWESVKKEIQIPREQYEKELLIPQLKDLKKKGLIHEDV